MYEEILVWTRDFIIFSSGFGETISGWTRLFRAPQIRRGGGLALGVLLGFFVIGVFIFSQQERFMIHSSPSRSEQVPPGKFIGSPSLVPFDSVSPFMSGPFGHYAGHDSITQQATICAKIISRGPLLTNMDYLGIRHGWVITSTVFCKILICILIQL